MWLIVDDTRTLCCDVVATTAEAGRTVLGGLGYAFEGVLLDHDLGPGESGYDLLVWALEAEVLPPIVQLISMNPVGVTRMKLALRDAGWLQDPERSTIFTKPEGKDE